MTLIQHFSVTEALALAPLIIEDRRVFRSSRIYPSSGRSESYLSAVITKLHRLLYATAC